MLKSTTLAAAVLAALLAAGSGQSQAAAVPATGGPYSARLQPAITALDAGKPDAAVQLLTAEMNKSASDPAAVAVLSYYRGLAHAQAGRRVQALADLNLALYRDRLPADLKGAALEARKSVQSGRPMTPASAAVPAAAGPAPNVPAQVVTAETIPESSGWQTAVAQPIQSAGAPAWETTSGTMAVTPRQSVAAAEVQPLGYAASNAPSTAIGTPPAIPDGQLGLGDFLAGLFVSKPASAPAAQTPAETASIEPLASAEGSGWETTAQLHKGQAAPIENLNGAAGPFLRLAALRSPQEAQATADRIAVEQAGLLGVMKPDVRPATVGNMGTFYEVTLGPFADLRKSAKLCDQLTSAGVDCLLIRR